MVFADRNGATPSSVMERTARECSEMMSDIDRVPTASFATEPSDLAVRRERIEEFVTEIIRDVAADGVVVGMSGGVDSTLATTLAVEALGPERVTPLVLPSLKSAESHVRDARMAAADLGLDPITIQLRPLVDMFEGVVMPWIDDDTDKHALGNVTARLRMACLYYTANRLDRLVLGTSNRTELLLGYFTKYGDGAADLRPLAGLYKTEIRALAAAVDVPPRIIEKPATADLWVGQTDETDLGAPYGLLDIILHKLVDENLSIAGTADELGISTETVAEYAEMHVATRHKRHQPSTPAFDRPVGGESFHELETRLG